MQQSELKQLQKNVLAIVCDPQSGYWKCLDGFERLESLLMQKINCALKKYNGLRVNIGWSCSSLRSRWFFLSCFRLFWWTPSGCWCYFCYYGLKSSICVQLWRHSLSWLIDSEACFLLCYICRSTHLDVPLASFYNVCRLRVHAGSLVSHAVLHNLFPFFSCGEHRQEVVVTTSCVYRAVCPQVVFAATSVPVRCRSGRDRCRMIVSKSCTRLNSNNSPASIEWMYRFSSAVEVNLLR